MWAEQQRDLEEAAIDALGERVSAEDIARFGDHAVTRVSANAADAIVDFARAARVDLVVMGTHGREVVDPVGIGSVSARVVHSAPCPVLTVKRAAQSLGSPALMRSTASA